MSIDILEAIKIEIPIMEALETDDMPVTLNGTLFQTWMGQSLPLAQTYPTLQAAATAAALQQHHHHQLGQQPSLQEPQLIQPQQEPTFQRQETEIREAHPCNQ